MLQLLQLLLHKKNSFCGHCSHFKFGVLAQPMIRSVEPPAVGHMGSCVHLDKLPGASWGCHLGSCVHLDRLPGASWVCLRTSSSGPPTWGAVGTWTGFQVLLGCASQPPAVGHLGRCVHLDRLPGASLGWLRGAKGTHTPDTYRILPVANPTISALRMTKCWHFFEFWFPNCT